VRVAVRHWSPSDLEPQLARGDVDLAITIPDPSHPSLRVRHLFEETYVLVGRAGHPQVKRGLTVEDFARLEQVIVSPSGGSFTTPVDDVLAALGHRRTIVMSASSFLFVLEIVSRSDLVALVPSRLLGSGSDGLARAEIPWLAERFDISLIWHERSHAHPGHRWLRELIAELVPGPDDDAPAAAGRRHRAASCS
jgi:DNA-binding transcriptional LysR family regulator